MLKEVGLMKNVIELEPCSKKLVQELIVKLSAEMENGYSQEYMRVFVRGKCIKFSLKVINPYPDRRKFALSQNIPSLDQIDMEITSGKVKKWPKKSGIPTGSLTVICHAEQNSYNKLGTYKSQS